MMNDQPTYPQQEGSLAGQPAPGAAPPPPPPETGAGSAPLTKDDTTWATIAHLAGFVGFVGVPLGNLLGPLVVWLVKRNESGFVDEAGKEAVNFQITMTIAGLIAALLIFVVIGLLLLPVLLIVDIVFMIMAAVKTSNGEQYRYPVSIRFIK